MTTTAIALRDRQGIAAYCALCLTCDCLGVLEGRDSPDTVVQQMQGFKSSEDVRAPGRKRYEDYDQGRKGPCGRKSVWLLAVVRQHGHLC
eukprot:2583932-Pleurochrysis_carterae.AAC.1